MKTININLVGLVVSLCMTDWGRKIGEVERGRAAPRWPGRPARRRLIRKAREKSRPEGEKWRTLKKKEKEKKEREEKRREKRGKKTGKIEKEKKRGEGADASVSEADRSASREA